MHEQIDSVYVIFNEFKSVIAQRLIAQRILPVQELGRREVALAEEFTLEQRERMGEAARSAGISLKEPEPTRRWKRKLRSLRTQPVDYIYEQPPEEIFADLLPRYIAFEIFQGMLESVAAENAARMTAMESASNNANEVIDSLTLTMNRARQATITKEIIEIVSERRRFRARQLSVVGSQLSVRAKTCGVVMQASRYQDLRAWQKEITLVEQVYEVTSSLPPRRDVWAEKPDAALRGIDTEQHRRGPRPRDSRGISTVLGSCARFFVRT